MILRKIYCELVLIRKELQSIRSAMEPKSMMAVTKDSITCQVQ